MKLAAFVTDEPAVDSLLNKGVAEAEYRLGYPLYLSKQALLAQLNHGRSQPRDCVAHSLEYWERELGAKYRSGCKHLSWPRG